MELMARRAGSRGHGAGLVARARERSCSSQRRSSRQSHGGERVTHAGTCAAPRRTFAATLNYPWRKMLELYGRGELLDALACFGEFAKCARNEAEFQRRFTDCAYILSKTPRLL